jgi:L-ascorbate metabolism protein UlaG (beta-lactamase superfamily)
MMKTTIFLLFMSNLISFGQKKFEQDIIQTVKGDLKITFIGHGSLMFEFQGKFIYIDPVMQSADYNTMPDADLILITHEHGDHLDQNAISALKKSDTEILLTQKCFSMLKETTNTRKISNGSTTEAKGIKITAIPAYNIQNKRPDGTPYHPKGEGNGYIIEFGDKKVLVAGDTENMPEIKALKGIDIAFLPMNLPYTMTPAMVADAASAFRPKVLYPYHFGDTNTSELLKLLEKEKEIEVRIRQLK